MMHLKFNKLSLISTILLSFFEVNAIHNSINCGRPRVRQFLVVNGSQIERGSYPW